MHWHRIPNFALARGNIEDLNNSEFGIKGKAKNISQKLFILSALLESLWSQRESNVFKIAVLTVAEQR